MDNTRHSVCGAWAVNGSRHGNVRSIGGMNMRKAVVLVDSNGVIVCELEHDGMFYYVPKEWRDDFPLDVGDVYRVIEIETED